MVPLPFFIEIQVCFEILRKLFMFYITFYALPFRVTDFKSRAVLKNSVFTSECLMLFLAAGGWSEAGYHCITLGRATSSVRSLSVVADSLWAAYRNCVIVINPRDLTVKVICCYAFF